jgi:hypothetical protein
VAHFGLQAVTPDEKAAFACCRTREICEGNNPKELALGTQYRQTADATRLHNPLDLLQAITRLTGEDAPGHRLPNTQLG